jgi:hypothetical protein
MAVIRFISMGESLLVVPNVGVVVNRAKLVRLRISENQFKEHHTPENTNTNTTLDKPVFVDTFLTLFFCRFRLGYFSSSTHLQ